MVSSAVRLAGAVVLGALSWFGPAAASDFSRPWQNPDRALVLDAYEYTAIDWGKLAQDKRVAGFINKASDGLPPAYSCSGNETEIRLCKALWKRYAVARELFHTRRTVARALGLVWGAYHLARPGNPIDQANHFLDFAEPADDELIALDLEGNDPSQWMSFADAEEFARHIHRRTGRYPVLYTNGSTARYIADHADEWPLLSRLKLWYARYEPEIGEHFPKGAWSGYALWQFASNINCGPRHCPVRISGTPHDIDVNVAPMSAEALRKAWPLNGLVDGSLLVEARVPLPIARHDGMVAPVEIAYAAVVKPSAVEALEHAFATAGNRYPRGGTSIAPALPVQVADYVESDVFDTMTTGSVPRDAPPARRRFRR